jgi:hypothetical protein
MIPTWLDFTILIAHRMGLRLRVTSREPQCCLEDLSEGAALLVQARWLKLSWGTLRGFHVVHINNTITSRAVPRTVHV